jgi:hypothetical protein
MKNLIVIDDFYTDPWAVREYALNKALYLTPEQVNPEFAGTESVRGIYSAPIIDKIENALGQKIEVNPKSYAFGVFSKTYQQDKTKKSIHVDGSDWTAVLYLSRPEDCEGGTAFYENMNWQWSEIPSDEVLSHAGFISRSEFVAGPLKAASSDFTQWKVSSRVGMKFNRMVLFRAGTMFHAAEGYFGSNDDNCRLLQLFFFKIKGV